MRDALENPSKKHRAQGALLHPRFSRSPQGPLPHTAGNAHAVARGRQHLVLEPAGQEQQQVPRARKGVAMAAVVQIQAQRATVRVPPSLVEIEHRRDDPGVAAAQAIQVPRVAGSRRSCSLSRSGSCCGARSLRHWVTRSLAAPIC